MVPGYRTGYRKGTCARHKDCDNKRQSCAPLTAKSPSSPDSSSNHLSMAAVAVRPSTRQGRPKATSPDPDFRMLHSLQRNEKRERDANKYVKGELHLRDGPGTHGALPQNIPVRKQSLARSGEDSFFEEHSRAKILAVTPRYTSPISEVQRPESEDSNNLESKGSIKPRPRRNNTLPPLNTGTGGVVGRQSTSRLPPVDEVPPTPSLRSSASIPDYRLLKKAHPSSGSVSPKSAHSLRAHDSGHASFPMRQNPSNSHGSMVSRESTRSNSTAHASSSGDLSSATERSSVMTSRTSTSDYVSPVTPWSVQPQEEEIGIDELLAMYANGFTDDPTDSMSPVNRLLPPSPLGPHREAEKEPPIPKIPDSISTMGLLTKTSESTSPKLITPKATDLTRITNPPPKTLDSESRDDPSFTRKPSIPLLPTPSVPPESLPSLPRTRTPSESISSFVPSSKPAESSSNHQFRSQSMAHSASSASATNPSNVPVPPSPSPQTPTSASSIVSSLAPPRTGLRSVDANVRSSAAIMAGTVDSGRVNVASPTSSLTRNPSRDRYGFKKDSQHIKHQQHDVWDTAYEPYVSRRREKWDALMRQYDLSTGHPTIFPPRSDKVKRFVRKGIPPEWRGEAWFYYSGGPARLASHRGNYENLVGRIDMELKDIDREHIERDLHRTLPDNDKFKPDPPHTSSQTTLKPSDDARDSCVSGTSSLSLQPENCRVETPYLVSLRRVLQAFAVAHPAIGYCQSLNFLAAQLLLFLHKNEEKAFHLLCIMSSQYLPGTHGVALEGANIDITVLMMALKEVMPALWGKLDDRVDAVARSASRKEKKDSWKKESVSSASTASSAVKRKPDRKEERPGLPTVSLATTSWFMSCFVGTLPPETCARVWDVLFYEGSKTLFRVALGVFKFVDTEVRDKIARRGKNCPPLDPMEVFQSVQVLPKTLIDANALMEASFGKNLEGRGLLSGDMVEGWREERRGVYQKERDASQETLTSPAPAEEADDKDKRPSSRGSLKRSTSLKRLPTRLKRLGTKKSVFL